MSQVEMAAQQAEAVAESVQRTAASEQPKQQHQGVLQKVEDKAFGIADRVALWEQRRAVFHQAGRLARGENLDPVN